MDYSIDLNTFINYECNEKDFLDVEKLKQDAVNGNDTAQLILGTIFYYGNNVLEKNGGYAFYWFKKSSEQGNCIAQEYLAYCYRDGTGVNIDYNNCFYWLVKAANSNNYKAEFYLGYLYFNGIHTSEKKHTAFNYIKHSALFGYGDAQNYMGLYYEFGYIFKKDIETAIEWYLLAAKQEHVTAQINLGYAYLKMKNYRKAIEWTLKAAKKGNEEAIKNLDMILEETFWAQGEKYKNLKYHNPSEPIEIGDLVFSNEFNEAFAWLREYQNKSKSNDR